MSKRDLIEDVPAEVPRKRRALERAPDVWLAVWLDRDDLSAGDRKRAQAERDRRKAERAREQLRLGVIVADEGLTPWQLMRLASAVVEAHPTAVLHTRVPRKMHGVLMEACRQSGALAELVTGDDAAVVRQADAIVAAPREHGVQPYATPGVWSMIGLARHRSLPVWVVLPDGTAVEGGQLHG